MASAHLVGDVSNWDIEGFQSAIQTVMPIPEKLENPDDVAAMELDEIEKLLRAEAESLYDLRTMEFGEETMVTLERAIMLRTIDSQWVEHLTAMDNMRQGIGLQAAGQRDPPGPIQAPVLRNVHRSAGPYRNANCPDHLPRCAFSEPWPARKPASWHAESREWPRCRRPENGRAAGQKSIMSNVTQGHGAAAGPGNKKIGRNQKCPCGSGKKYKRCCGRA